MTESGDQRRTETRVVYTCWPCGPGSYTLCGAALLVIGFAILVDALLPGSSEVIWGVALLALGGWVLTRRHDVERRW